MKHSSVKEVARNGSMFGKSWISPPKPETESGSRCMGYAALSSSVEPRLNLSTGIIQ